MFEVSYERNVLSIPKKKNLQQNLSHCVANPLYAEIKGYNIVKKILVHLVTS
jgi:hypothetical protein